MWVLLGVLLWYIIGIVSVVLVAQVENEEVLGKDVLEGFQFGWLGLIATGVLVYNMLKPRIKKFKKKKLW